MDTLEEKYENDDNDEELEKQGYSILFHILYLSNSKICQEFNNLYMAIAKIIKIETQKNPIKLVANVLHSTLQTYYKQLTDARLDDDEEKEEKGNDHNLMFDLNQMSHKI